MKHPTKRDLALAFLIHRGFTEVLSESEKYRKFVNLEREDYTQIAWIGRRGAMRFGRISSESVSSKKWDFIYKQSLNLKGLLV